jgi:hypothetical protein
LKALGIAAATPISGFAGLAFFAKLVLTSVFRERDVLKKAMAIFGGDEHPEPKKKRLNGPLNRQHPPPARFPNQHQGGLHLEPIMDFLFPLEVTYDGHSFDQKPIAGYVKANTSSRQRFESIASRVCGNTGRIYRLFGKGWVRGGWRHPDI